MAKPSRFSDRISVATNGYDNNCEFRVDGFTLDYVEIADDFKSAIINDGETLIDIEGPNELLRIMMQRHNVHYEQLRFYAELMLPNLDSIAMWPAA